MFLADRVKETSATTGTGAVDLDGPVSGFQSFVSAGGDARETYYVIVGQAGGDAAGEWETGIGTISAGTPNTLSRDTVISSSNSGAAVNFSAGTKDVFLSLPADRVGPVVLDAQSPSADSTIDFALPTDFEVFHLVGWLSFSQSARLSFRLSTDGGSTFVSGASAYGWVTHRAFTSGADSAEGDNSDSSLHMMATSTEDFIHFDAHILGAGDATARTGIHGQNRRAVANYGVEIFGGARTSAEAHNAVRLATSAGTLTGSLRLLGIR